MTPPGLHLEDWRPTTDTLHLYSQIPGKIRLATAGLIGCRSSFPTVLEAREEVGT